MKTSEADSQAAPPRRIPDSVRAERPLLLAVLVSGCDPGERTGHGHPPSPEEASVQVPNVFSFITGRRPGLLGFLRVAELIARKELHPHSSLFSC